MLCQPPFWFKYEFCSMGPHWGTGSINNFALEKRIFLSLLFLWYSTAAATQSVACLALFLLPQPTIKNQQSPPDFFQIFPYFNHFNQSDLCLSLQTLVEQPGQLFLWKCYWSPGDSLFSPLFAAASSSIGFLLKQMQCWTYHKKCLEEDKTQLSQRVGPKWSGDCCP